MLNRLKNHKEQLKKEVQEMEQVELSLAEKKEAQSTGSFTGLVLLDSVTFDIEAFLADFKKDWDIEITSIHTHDDTVLVFEVDEMIATISLVPEIINKEELLVNAQSNFYWPDAEEVTKKHKAHLVIATLNKSNTIVNTGEFFVKVAASCLKQDNATAINSLNIVFRGGFYRDNALLTINEENRFPLLNLVFLELYTTDGTSVSAYTYGLEALGKKEIEIVESNHQMEDVHLLLYNTVLYILEHDIELKTGETIGFSEDQTLNIVESLSFALDRNKTTIKIDY